VRNETNEVHGGAISPRSRAPFDVRVVAYLFYSIAFVRIPLGILMAGGMVVPVGEPRPILLGFLVIASGVGEGVYSFLTGLCWLVCAWGLMRGMKFAWWFAMALSAYYLTDEVLQLHRYPWRYAIGVAVEILLIAWLWFRREFYGIRPTEHGITS
jgi:hypothetical protein